MSKTNPRPYNRKKPVDRNINTKNVNKFVKKSKVAEDKTEIMTPEEELNVTTRIRIDDNRINDSESLDTSFLEGRIGKKVSNDTKEKEKILKDNTSTYMLLDVVKKVVFLISFICLILLVILYLHNKLLDLRSKTNKNIDIAEIDELVRNDDPIIDDNYLFVGDFYIDDFNFDDYDFHYVKSSEDDLSTSKVLESINDKIYKYNPSKVFINLGYVDLVTDKSVNEIISNYEEIIKNIKLNRPYAEIYVISVFPINNDYDDFDENIDNDKIKELNKKLETMCSDNKVEYVDVYKSLVDNNDELNDKYTEDGYHLNKDGYKVFKQAIDNIIK